MSPGPSRKYLLIALLYVSQAVPLGFFTIAVPAILRKQGVGLEAIGLVGALALPWLLKFLWAPLVDGWGSTRLGHYRSWIVPLQLASVLCVTAIAFMRPDGALIPLVLAGGMFMIFSATQDIATDGLAVRILDARERGAGNGIQVGGYYLGQVLGGGAVLWVFSRFGWPTAILAMAVFLSLPLLPLAGFREPQTAPAERKSRPDFRTLGAFFGRPGMRVWLAVLLLYRTGEQMAVTMLNPLLVDRGMTLDQIGLLLGLAASVGALGGSVVGGLTINRVGRKLSMAAFSALQALCLGTFVLPALGIGGSPLIWLVATGSAFAGGMATAALYTNMMDRCESATAGTDFTVQQALAAFGPILGASLSGFSAAALGYAGHFTLCTGVALGTVFMITRWLWITEPIPARATTPRSA